MDSRPVFSRERYTDHLSKLAQATAWLKIERGRAVVYAHLVREFFEAEGRTRDHILAFNESYEIVDLFKLWRPCADQFPGVEQHLRRVCKKGPLLREGENPQESTNSPRNYAFSYLVSGTLIAAGIDVVAVEGMPRLGSDCTSTADLVFRWDNALIDVQCKRPQSAAALISRMQEACEQIRSSGRCGVVALDCSPSIRPAGQLLEYANGERGEGSISRILETVVAPRLTPHLSPEILGLMLLARIPSMMRIGESQIVSAKGRPFQTFRPESVLSWLIVSNSDAPQGDILRSASELIQSHQQRRRACVTQASR